MLAKVFDAAVTADLFIQMAAEETFDSGRVHPADFVRIKRIADIGKVFLKKCRNGFGQTRILE